MTPFAACGLRCRVMSLALAAVSGTLFGVGLILAGMTDPARVIGFLDVAGRWDPSLAFVMGSAVVVYALAFRWIQRRRNEPWFDVSFHVPRRSDVDAGLVVGSALFGIGWGLGGFCPGPGLVAAASGSGAGLAFVVAMLAGMGIQRRVTVTR